MAAETLYRERRLSVSAIAKKLHVSKSTLYSYLCHRGVEIGPYEKSAQTRTDGQADGNGGTRTATVLLWLRVENNSKFVRGKKRARENIERYLLKEYAAKLRPSGQYELKVLYRTDEDLDKPWMNYCDRSPSRRTCAVLRRRGRHRSVLQPTPLHESDYPKPTVLLEPC